jgi:hypothetical protein
MLKQWNKDVLTQWLEVFCLSAKAKLSKINGVSERNELIQSITEITLKMTEISQPIAVRVSSTCLIAALAFYDCFGDKEIFATKGFIRKSKFLI